MLKNIDAADLYTGLDDVFKHLVVTSSYMDDEEFESSSAKRRKTEDDALSGSQSRLEVSGKYRHHVVFKS